MSQHHLVSRSLRITAGAMLLLGTLLFRGGAAAHSEPARPSAKADARACQIAYRSGQEKEQSGQLVEASALFAQCAEETCGVTLWQDCIVRGTRLSSALPSVVPLVVDDKGDPRIDVQVKMDGRVIASQLNGRAIPVDPGTHQFSFSTQAGVFASRQVTFAKGERNRTLAVSVPSDSRIRAQSAAMK
jgi:hypothetical protein